MDTPDRKSWAIDRTNYWWDFLANKWDAAQLKIPSIVDVKFSDRYTRVAGKAILVRVRQIDEARWAVRPTVTFSTAYLYNEKPEDFDKVVAHEVSHNFADLFHNERCGHGDKWKRIFASTGFEPSRCHQFETYKKLKRVNTRYNFTCPGCNTTGLMSGNFRTRFLKAKSPFRCVKCKTIHTYELLNDLIPVAQLDRA